MPGFILSAFSAIGSWWKSMSWTTRIQLIVVIAVVAVIGIQWQIIHSNKIKIAELETKVGKMQYEQQFNDLKTKVDALQTSINTTNDLIAKNSIKIGKLEREVYTPYKPDPNQTAEKVVEGFKGFRNEPK